MSVNLNYRAGLRNVGSYQVSGVPYMTGSGYEGIAASKIHMQQFPYVTKSITVINAGTVDLYVHFQSGSGVAAFTKVGVAGEKSYSGTSDVISGYHYIAVPANSGSVTFDVKCKEVFISNPRGSAGGYQIFAELTQVPTSSMFHLTGSGITE